MVELTIIHALELSKQESKTTLNGGGKILITRSKYSFKDYLGYG